MKGAWPTRPDGTIRTHGARTRSEGGLGYSRDNSSLRYAIALPCFGYRMTKGWGEGSGGTATPR